MTNKTFWKKLEKHANLKKSESLNKMFGADTQRGYRYTIESDHLVLDYSKNHLDSETLELLYEYAHAIDLNNKIRLFMQGSIINQTEKRAALHCSLRDIDNRLGIESKIHTRINSAREKMFALAKKINNGDLVNHQNQPFKHLICIGIGGSYLGPKFLLDALKDKQSTSLSIHYIASIDPDAFDKVLRSVNIEQSLFFIASKSFNTLEVIHNAEKVKNLLLENGVPKSKLPDYFIASTENIRAAESFGCAEDRILPLWDFVGGRFSLWSSIGFPILLAYGENVFLELLQAAHKLDIHFLENTFDKNLPITLALIAFWYQVFFEAPTRAIIPYSHKLKTFPAYLQQLEMESLGKSVNTANNRLDYPTGAIIWGSEGPNSQHAFHQLLLQGTHLVPCDFIVAKQNIKDQQSQDILIAQCLSQSAAMAFGNKLTEQYRHIEGNQPSNTLFLDKVSPSSLGELLAVYEHKTFALSVLLDINAFDQWGVQLGKTLTGKMAKAMSTRNYSSLDSSSASLASRLK